MCQEAGEREWEVLDVRKEWQVRVSEEDACGVTCEGSYQDAYKDTDKDAYKKACRDSDMEREEVRRKAQEAKLKAYKVVVYPRARARRPCPCRSPSLSLSLSLSPPLSPPLSLSVNACIGHMYTCDRDPCN